MIKTVACALFSFAISFLASAQSQNIQFDRLWLEHGLSQSTVNCILQDRTGFMWFGTLDGLNRYDGYNVAVYRPDPQRSNSISSNQILSLYEDKYGVIWIGTGGGGLNKYDAKSEIFEHCKYGFNDSCSLNNSTVWAIYEDPSDSGKTMWIGTQDGGLNKLILSNHEGGERDIVRVDQYKHHASDPNSLGNDTVNSILKDSKGDLWIGTLGGGLHKLIAADEDGTPLISHYVYDAANPHSISSNEIMCISEDSLHQLWVGTNGGGINILDRKGKNFRRIQHNPLDKNSLSSNYIWTLYTDSAGSIWVGTSTGLNKVISLEMEKNNQVKAKFARFYHNPNDPSSISDNSIYSIYQDRAGVLWFGTVLGGISKYSPFKNKFPYYSTNTPNSPLSSNFIRSVFKNRQNTLWIGTEDKGLIKIEREKGKVTYLQHESGNPYSLQTRSVRALYEDQFGFLWIGTAANGLHRFDPRKMVFDIYTHDPKNLNTLCSDNITCIFEDKMGLLWIGTTTGLNKFDRKKENFSRYFHAPPDEKGLAHLTVWTIQPDSLGNLWIGTSGAGLVCFNPQNESYIQYLNNPNDSSSLSYNDVTSLCVDRQNQLWIGTYGGGLNNLQLPQSGQIVLMSNDRTNISPLFFKHFREKDGLPNEVIYGMVMDQYGKLWLSSNKGLSSFDPLTETFRNYDISDGLQSNEFNRGVCFKAYDGELIFGGVNGVNAFYPDQITENPYRPPVVITNFRLDNQSVNHSGASRSFLRKPIHDMDEIKLAYHQNFFSFEFSALDFSNPSKNLYAYRLVGVDKDWVYCGTRRFANYTQIGPGRYTFRVKGSNNDGVWNEDGASLAIIITPPWWHTGWAYGFYILFVLGAAYGAVSYVVKRQKRKVLLRLQAEQEQRRLEAAEHRAVVAELQAKTAEAEKEIEKEQMRRRIAGDLHDEIGSNLSTIALISQMEANKLKSRAAGKSRLKEIPKIARQTAESMRDIIWFINPENESMDRLIIKMRETANLMLDQVNFTFKAAPCGPFAGDVNFRRHLYLIYKEILQNIIRHARATLVDIAIEEQEKSFQLRVADDGVGFDVTQEYAGNGLKNLKRRAMDMGGTVQVTSSSGHGTAVVFTAKIP